MRARALLAAGERLSRPDLATSSTRALRLRCSSAFAQWMRPQADGAEEQHDLAADTGTGGKRSVRTSATAPRRNSSCSLVSSRATTTCCAAPKMASTSASVSRIRCAALHKKSACRDFSALGDRNASSAVRRWPSFAGRNPWKVNDQGADRIACGDRFQPPLAIKRADGQSLAPGMGKTGMPFAAMAARGDLAAGISDAWCAGIADDGDACARP